MCGILQMIDMQNEMIFGMLVLEQWKVVGVFDVYEVVGDVQVVGVVEIQDSICEVLMMIGEQLMGLIWQEIEMCFC